MARFVDYMPSGFIKNLLSGKLRDTSGDISAARYDAGKGTDLSAYGVKDKQASDFNPEDDPIYQLELQRADALNPTGGGDGGLGRALAQAAAQYSYGGPSIDQINQFGREGQSRISNLYAQLDQYLQGQKGETAGNYNAAQMRAAAAYQNAAKDIATAQQTAANVLAQQSAGGAGAAAGQESTAAANAAIQRQAALNTTNQANAMSSFQQLGTGHQAILGDLAAGMQRERGAQSGKLSDQISGMVQQAIREQDLAKQRTAMAQQEIRDKYAERQSEAAGKNQAAKLKALEDAITRNEKKQGKEDDFSGMRGVLAFAMKQGRPDLAETFLSKLTASRTNAANINASPEVQQGIKKKTTPEEQLQIMLSGTDKIGQRFDLGDQNLDLYRGDFLNQVRNIPELAFLKKYLVSTPEQARSKGLYQPAFGRSQQAYEEGVKGKSQSGVLGALESIFGGGPGNNVSIGSNTGRTRGQTFEDQMRQRFSPFVNIEALRGNLGDVQRYYNYFGGGQDTDLLGSLYNIYTGKYGKGNF